MLGLYFNILGMKKAAEELGILPQPLHVHHPHEFMSVWNSAVWILSFVAAFALKRKSSIYDNAVHSL